MRVPPKSFPFDLAGWTIGLTTLAFFYGGIRAFYYGGDFLASFSYVSDERTFNEIANSWIGRDPQETLFGVHAFGDYVISNVWSSFGNAWAELEMVIYPPPILLFYRILGFLPYDWGLSVYMVLLVACTLAPMIIATRRLPIGSRILLISVLGLLTGPAIAALDRGNSQGLLPIVLFAFAVTIIKQRWGWAAFLIALAAIIKVYPIALILLLLALRQYKWAAAAVGWSAAMVLVSMPFISTAGIFGLPEVFGDILEFQERTFIDFMAYNVSLAGGLANAAAFLGLGALAAWIAANPLVIVVVYAAVVVPLLWMKSIEVWIRVVLALSLPSTLMPVVYAYALNWVLAASAFTIWIVMNSSAPQVIRPLAARLLLVSFMLGTAMLPVFIPGSAEAGRPAGVVSLAAVAIAFVLPAAAWFSRVPARTSGSPEGVVPSAT